MTAKEKQAKGNRLTWAAWSVLSSLRAQHSAITGLCGQFHQEGEVLSQGASLLPKFTALLAVCSSFVALL